MRKYIFGLLVFASVTQFANGADAQSAGAEMDATAYKIDSTKAMVEIDYGIIYRTLAFSSDHGGWTAPIDARVEAWQSGKLIASQDIHQQVHFQGTKKQLDSSGALKAIGVVNLPIGYGPEIRVRLLWNYKKADGSLATDSSLVTTVSPPELYSDRLSFSSIELASNVEKATIEGNPFEKVGYIVTPNPSGVFGEAYTKLYYFAELYLPASFVIAGANAQINAVIQDGAGHTLANTSRSQELIAQSIPVLGSLDIDGLPTDSYKLIITASRNGAVEAQISKQFFYESGIMLTEEPATAAAVNGSTDEQSIYLNSEMSKMPESELEERFEQASYMAKPDEKKAWTTINTPDEKRKYLFNFWRKRDKPSEAALDAYRVYTARTAEAIKQYTHQKTPGWKTDMGRVFMMYGPYSREVLKTFSTEARPIKVWEYNDKSIRINPNGGEEMGGMTYTASLPHFVFIDRQGAGKYVLVHSNVVGETPEPGWYTREAKRTY
jgi:GWxTD domain-containing protein